MRRGVGGGTSDRLVSCAPSGARSGLLPTAGAVRLRSVLPEPPPPPPPPSRSAPERRSRLRNFNWEPIPAARIGGRHNVWTATGARRGAFPLDLRLLDELFEQRPDPPGGRQLGQQLSQQVSLLDSKKVLNLGIFLKQFKRPVQDIVADIWDGDGSRYGAEKLLELTKMLPDAEEVKTLVAFQGRRSRLSEAELFALLLVQVPSYACRLELLLLKEEFFPCLRSLRSAIQILTEAALELLDCEELHDLIRLVLMAGNYMNEGGYAGSALGFRVPSLLRLADTKANRPGMDLLHFVALEVKKKDPNLLCFPSKLQHLGPASRIVDREVMAEFQNLGERLLGARGSLEALGLEAQMDAFVREAEAELMVTRASLECLRQATIALCNFLCEDLESFSVSECCGTIRAFGECFQAAVQENQVWEAAERRRRQCQDRERKAKRHSIATCSVRDPGLQDVKLDLLFLQAPPPYPGQHSRSLQGPCSPQAGGKPLPLGRRHTLARLSPCSEAPTPEPARDPLPSSDLQKAPTAVAAAATRSLSKGLPLLPGAPNGFRFPRLFHKTTLPEPELENRTSPPAAPQAISALAGFFRCLSFRDQPQGSSQA